MTRLNKSGWILAACSLAVLLVSVERMSKRVDEFHRHAEFARHHFELITVRSFRYADRVVELEDDTDGRGRAAIRLTYGDETRLIPVREPPVRDLPELDGYESWLAVLAISDIERPAPGAPSRVVVGTERVVIVTRSTPEGFDPETWGAVRRVEWTFDFYELLPDGTIEHSTFRFPRSERGERRLAGDPGNPLAAYEPLRERTWQYQAALFATPPLQVPRYRFKDDAVYVMGWTLPTAGFAVLGLAIGLAMAFAPRHRGDTLGESRRRAASSDRG